LSSAVLSKNMNEKENAPHNSRVEAVLQTWVILNRLDDTDSDADFKKEQKIQEELKEVGFGKVRNRILRSLAKQVKQLNEEELKQLPRGLIGMFNDCVLIEKPSKAMKSSGLFVDN